MNLPEAIKGLPPHLRDRCQLALAQKEAADRIADEEGTTPLAVAALAAALDELENCHAVLSEFTTA